MGVSISPGDFAKLKQRLSSSAQPGRGVSSGAAESATLAKVDPDALPAVGLILGVDPSLRGTGWGVLRVVKPQPIALAQGTIRCPAKWARSRCLAFIAETLRDVLQKYPAELCAVEGLFHARNLRTALIMGEARGAALSAVAATGIPVFEIAPRRVKLAIVGFGGAQKIAVAKMVQRLTGLSELPEADAADALALALTYAQEAGRFSRANSGVSRV